MLPLKSQTISPYLRDRTRLALLSSGSSFGMSSLHDEHLMERLNSLMNNLDNPDMHRQHELLKIVDYPELTRARTSDTIASDMLLKDTFRQHSAINERYRKLLVGLEDIRNIYEPSTKYHRAISRGYERHLVDFIGKLDAEMLNRSTLKPA